MTLRIKKIFGALAITSALILVNSKKIYAFGETGCIRNPENIVGTCFKNTEGIWKCVAHSVWDCTESGD